MESGIHRVYIRMFRDISKPHPEILSNEILVSEDYTGVDNIVREFEGETKNVYGEGARSTEVDDDNNELQL